MEEILSSIKQSKRIVELMENRTAGATISGDKCTILSVACLRLAYQHQRSIVLLIEHRLIGSAFALLRVLFETHVRAVWLLNCSSTADIDEFEKCGEIRRGGKKLEFGSLIEEIEKLVPYDSGHLTKQKRHLYKLMNDYTHTGMHQIGCQLSTETFDSHYKKSDLIGWLKFCDWIGLRSAIEMAMVCKSESFAEELLLEMKKLSPLESDASADG